MKHADLGHLLMLSLTLFPSPLQMAMKCADLGHLASAKSVHLKWVSLLEEEMFRQGDMEKAKGYPLSPLMDRDRAGITLSQPGVRPIYKHKGA